MSHDRIDSHQHFLKPGRITYSWMDLGMPIAKDFLPSDLEPILKRSGFARTILVEAADKEAENEFLFELAEQHDFIAGVVIWLNMEDAQFKERLLDYQKHPKFVGIRPMIESLPDDDWMLRPLVRKAFAVLQNNDICFDFLTHPRHLPYALQILEEFPKLRAVIDHISKPRIRDGEMNPWAGHMEKIASYEKVYCKLSGMITEADHQNWKASDLKPYVSHILGVFGPHRLMFGSDWPVCNLAGSYEDVLTALKRNLSNLTEQELNDIFGGTASRFYRV
jgi:L-fuconolactonase